MALNIFSVLCPNSAPIAYPLASRMISNSLFQLGVAMMGAITNLDLISSNADLNDSSKSNFASFSKNLHNGPEIFE